MRAIRKSRGNSKPTSNAAPRIAAAARAVACAVETLESRTMLSAAPSLRYGPDTAYIAKPLSTSASVTAQGTTQQPAHLVINPVFDSSISSDPNAAAIEYAINSTLQIFESEISTPITVTIKFKQITSGLAQSNKPLDEISYTTFRNALLAHATTPEDKLAVQDDVPAGSVNPVNGSANVILSDPNARALGLSATPTDGLDGTIGLNISQFFLNRNFTDSNSYFLQSSLSHEVDEVLGSATRLNNLQNGDPSPTDVIFPEDLFRFDQFGNRSFNTDVNTQAYLSIDGGNTDWAQFNQTQGGDFSDWYSPGGQLPEVQDAFGTPGSTPALGIELNMLDVMGFTLAAGVRGGVLPDLQPFPLAGWSSPLVLATHSGAVVDAASISSADTVYLDAAVMNTGEVTTTTAYKTTITLDGKTLYNFTDGAGLAVNNAYYSLSLNLGKLAAGSHTLTMVADPGNTVTEINEANNSYTRVFTVTAPSLPDLAPYKPTGWSAPLVVSTAKGVTTDPAKISTTDTLYVNAAYINDGLADITANYTTIVQLDGKTVLTFPNTGTQAVGIYNYDTDWGIGKLSAGSHTITMIIDSGNTIAESNEANNTYSRTFTVGGTVSQPPTIGSLTVSPTSVTAGATVTLTANNVLATGATIASVAFYRETNGQTGLQIGSDKQLGAERPPPTA